MSSIPCRCLCLDLVYELTSASGEMGQKVLETWEQFRGTIEDCLDAFEEEEMSWRDYCANLRWLPDPNNTTEHEKTQKLPDGFYFTKGRVYQICAGDGEGKNTINELGVIKKEILHYPGLKFEAVYCVPFWGSTHYYVVHRGGYVEKLPQMDFYIWKRVGSTESIAGNKLKTRFMFEAEEEARAMAVKMLGNIAGSSTGQPMSHSVGLRLIGVAQDQCLNVDELFKEHQKAQAQREEDAQRKQFEHLNAIFGPGGPKERKT